MRTTLVAAALVGMLGCDGNGRIGGRSTAGGDPIVPVQPAHAMATESNSPAERGPCVVLGDLCDTVVEAERSTQYNDPNYNKILPDYTACMQALREAVAYDNVAERAWKTGDDALSAKARCTQTGMCVRFLRQMVPTAQFAEPNCVGLY